MTSSVFVDTSGWAYLADRHDPFHQRVHSAYRRILAAKRRLVTTNCVIAELIPLLDSRTRITRPQILAFVDSLKAAPFLDITHVDVALDAAAWGLLKARRDKEWSLVDAASVVVMRQLGLSEALTTDHHFAQAGFVRLPTP